MSATLRSEFLLKGIEQAREIVASNYWGQPEAVEGAEFPEGV